MPYPDNYTARGAPDSEPTPLPQDHPLASASRADCKLLVRAIENFRKVAKDLDLSEDITIEDANSLLDEWYEANGNY